MAQLTISDATTIKKLQTDAAYRASFINNTEQFMGSVGHHVDAKTITTALDNQAPTGGAQAASTLIIITIF